MAKTLFVDTNVFLSLYAFSDDDIEQFRSLFVLAQEGEIDFLLPQQVIDEFWRNREAKIAESLQPFKKIPAVRLPASIRHLDESAEFLEASRAADKLRKSLIEEFLKTASKNELKADKLVSEIFDKSTVIKVTDDILEKAQIRMTIGNPPGKSRSYGDAINWECILTKVEVLDSLYFVSRDQDYESPLHPGKFNEFLDRELIYSQLSNVYFFPSLSAFMKEEFPGVEIDAFTEASKAIQQLEGSGSFATTHSAIFNLSNCSNFSRKQLQRLISTAEDNSQVSMILGDDDLDAFFKMLLSDYGKTLSKPWFDKLTALVGVQEPVASEFDEIPF